MPTLHELFTYRDVAAILKIHEGTLRKWASQGTIPVTKIGSKAVRFTPAQVQQIISGNLEAKTEVSHE